MLGPDTILWLAAVVLFIILEAITTALVSIWFMVGAVLAVLASLFTDSLLVQFLVFAVASAVALAIMVPTLKNRHRQNPPPVTNGSPLTIGKQGTVLRAIEPGVLGRVHVDGLDWQARSDRPLPEGARCIVTDVDGAVLIVSAVSVEPATV